MCLHKWTMCTSAPATPPNWVAIKLATNVVAFRLLLLLLRFDSSSSSFLISIWKCWGRSQSKRVFAANCDDASPLPHTVAPLALWRSRCSCANQRIGVQVPKGKWNKNINNARYYCRTLKRSACLQQRAERSAAQRTSIRSLSCPSVRLSLVASCKSVSVKVNAKHDGSRTTFAWLWTWGDRKHRVSFLHVYFMSHVFDTLLW